MAEILKVRLLIVDDHPLFRRGLVTVLRNEADFDVVCEAGDGATARDCIRTTPVDLAIVDMLMAGLSGVTLTQELRDAQPNCRVLGLSAVDEPGLIADMLRAGASGFALKTQPIRDIVDAVHQVHAGTRYLPPMLDAAAIVAQVGSIEAPRLNLLTKREREIFELIIRGYDTHAISQRLFIALRTVETHRQRITKKLSARSIVEWQRMATRFGGLGA